MAKFEKSVYAWCFALVSTKLLMLLPLIFLPVFYNHIVDYVIVGGQADRLGDCIRGIIVFVLLKYAFTMLDLIIVEKQKCVFFTKFGEMLWDKYFQVYRKKNIGDAERSFDRDLLNVSDFLNKYIVGNFISVSSVLIFLALLFYQHWKMTLIIMMLIPPMLYLVKAISRKNSQICAEQVEKENNNYNYLDRKFADWMQVKMTLEEGEVERIYENNLINIVNDRKKGLALGLAVEVVNYLLENFVCRLLVYIVGAFFVLEGSITLGIVILFAEYFEQIFKKIGLLALNNLKFSEDKLSLDRIFSILETERKEEGEHAWKNEIKVEDRLHGDFQVKKGEYVGIVGKSGSGKTTILNYLLGKKGNVDVNIMYDGILIDDENVVKAKKGILDINNASYVFEGTVSDNLCFMDNVDDEKLRELCNLFKVSVSFLKKPTGKNGNLLSGGERQILLMMRAVLCNCDMVVLDEITSALDRERRNIVRDIIENIWKGKTRIVVSHDNGLIVNAEHIYSTDDGRIKRIK